MNDNIKQFLIGLGFSQKSIEILQYKLSPELAKDLGEQLRTSSNIEVYYEFPEEDAEIEPPYVWFNSDEEPVKLLGGKTEYEYGLEIFDENNPRFLEIVKIIVGNEWTKDQLLKASEYFHDQRTTNTDFNAVNLIAHLYTVPDWIEVQ